MNALVKITKLSHERRVKVAKRLLKYRTKMRKGIRKGRETNPPYYIIHLERRYLEDPYWSRDEMRDLAFQFKLKPRVVYRWYNER